MILFHYGSTRGPRTPQSEAEWVCTMLLSFPAPLYLQICHGNPSQWLTNSPHNGWKRAGKVPGPRLMPSKCFILSLTAMSSTLAPLSTIPPSITKMYVLFPWECCSQAAVIVEKGSVKLIPTEVLIVDNNIMCHLLRDICVLWGVSETANSYLA